MTDLEQLPPKLYVVARRTVDGESRRDIGAEVNASIKSVERMRNLVYALFGVKDRFELAALVPDSKLKRSRKYANCDMRQGITLRAEEIAALDRVLAAAEMGKDVRVMVRDQMYRRARAVLVRAGQTAKKKLAALDTEPATGVVAKLNDSTKKAG